MEISLDLHEIAMMTGLNVEICHAIIQKMEVGDSINIRNGKIYF
ncbi:hypothetical protein QWZ06_09520 [Chryseobacterium tructae]|nr:hypothetical protein [Chryseobacterium tructae]MDN3692497.1 hypothetical protein [Chryseobacterium tructae]